MFGKKKDKKNAEANALPQLLETAMTLKYIGDFLLQGQCQGYEAEAHLKAIRMTKAQFDQVNADVELHPNYPAYLAEIKSKQEAARAKPATPDA